MIAALEASLKHFINLNTILYYRECLPNAVFLDPQPLLDKVTELVELSHQLRSMIRSASTATTSEVTKFRKEGLAHFEAFKESFLGIMFTKQIFSPLNIFCNFFIFDPLSHLFLVVTISCLASCLS